VLSDARVWLAHLGDSGLDVAVLGHQQVSPLLHVHAGRARLGVVQRSGLYLSALRCAVGADAASHRHMRARARTHQALQREPEIDAAFLRGDARAAARVVQIDRAQLLWSGGQARWRACVAAGAGAAVRGKAARA
jgi:hypothetical protein